MDTATAPAEEKVSLDELLKIIGLQQVELYQAQKRLAHATQQLEMLKPKPKPELSANGLAPAKIPAS